MSKITLIFQLAGIQYFNLSAETFETAASHNLTRKFKILFVVNISLVICELCAICFASYLELMQAKQGNAVTGQIVQIISYGFMIVVLLTTILNSFLLRGKAWQIFKNFKLISKTFLTLKQCVDYATFESEIKKTFTKLSIVFVGSTLVTVICISQYNQSNVLLWAVLAIYPYIFVVINCCYWTTLIRLIRENLRFVKKYLVQLHIDTKLFRNSPAVTSNLEIKLKKNFETYELIGKLKRIYGTIYETTSLINEFIAVPVCLVLIFVVVGNVSGGYKVFLSFRNDIPVERVFGKAVRCHNITHDLIMYLFSS